MSGRSATARAELLATWWLWTYEAELDPQGQTGRVKSRSMIVAIAGPGCDSAGSDGQLVFQMELLTENPTEVSWK